MNEMLAALEALTDRDPNRRVVAADVLGDLLRGTALDADSARLVVGRLVSAAVNDPVIKVRESALNSISELFQSGHRSGDGYVRRRESQPQVGSRSTPEERSPCGVSTERAQ
ncbi:hypothetical protein ACFVZH_39595 [Streptomyces sp. NPDC059534]|uniref:hypothetical protein n=1 Tax=Streptomyces sp. NPDC059534 TaxID=3346859 RepID=UPI0036D105E6